MDVPLKQKLLARRAAKSLKPADNCERCGLADREFARLHAHHWSYEKQHWQDVRWLCVKCHGRTHAELKNRFVDDRVVAARMSAEAFEELVRVAQEEKLPWTSILRRILDDALLGRKN